VTWPSATFPGSPLRRPPHEAVSSYEVLVILLSLLPCRRSWTKELSGRQFGRLTVTRSALPSSTSGAHRWYTNCECGKADHVVSARNLLMGISQSCGCLRMEKMQAASTKHGYAHDGCVSPEWHAWATMIQRCYNRNNPAWSRYGGRGISVCDQWKDSFPSFIRDMGDRPGPGYSIDRIDNNGNYERDNCRWATSTQQNRNRRSNRMIEYDGRSLSLAEWAESYHIPYSTLSARLKRGWTVSVALSVPIRPMARPRSQ